VRLDCPAGRSAVHRAPPCTTIAPRRLRPSCAGVPADMVIAGALVKRRLPLDERWRGGPIMSDHGKFRWDEYNTHDPKAACAFYAKALGWTFDEMPMPDSTYYIAKIDGKPVAGIFEMKGSQFAGMPPHWFAYIAVDDVDARVAAAAKLGAKL